MIWDTIKIDRLTYQKLPWDTKRRLLVLFGGVVPKRPQNINKARGLVNMVNSWYTYNADTYKLDGKG